jgi:hypothetical protein
MTISIVQPTGNEGGNNPTDPASGTNPITFTYADAQTAGNTNVIWLNWFDTTATFSTIADSKGNQYHIQLSSIANGMSFYCFVAQNIASAAANTNTVTIHVNLNGMFDFPEMMGIEVTGATAIDARTTTVATSTTGTPTTGPVTCNYNNELLLSYCPVTTSASGTPGAGWNVMKWGNGGVVTGNGALFQYVSTTTGGSFTASTPISSPGTWTQGIVGLANGKLLSSILQYTDTVFYGMT